MNDDLDINFLVQAFSDRISQLTNDNILKDAMIKQLNVRISELTGDKEKDLKDD